MLFGNSRKILDLTDQHFNKVIDCYSVYCDYISEYFNSGISAATIALSEQISTLEKEADSLRNEIISQLLTGALLPGTRKDIIEIVSSTDKIADKAEDLSREIVIEKVFIPPEMKDDIEEMTIISKDQLELLSEVVGTLFDNYEKLIKDGSLIDRIRQIESQADKIEFSLIKRLYEMDLDLAVKNQTKYFIHHMGDISDQIESIANSVQVMMIFRKV
ncbi:MAG: TIGR00153 family protein [Lachnospiraceae bacterium]|jgi:predicted phosphate transport protein (TIGR00153 family)|nr:TIGR00153 family protein [Lachnospiraceae bacterium]